MSKMEHWMVPGILICYWDARGHTRPGNSAPNTIRKQPATMGDANQIIQNIPKSYYFNMYIDGNLYRTGLKGHYETAYQL
jgi:hypothetical protein